MNAPTILRVLLFALLACAFFAVAPAGAIEPGDKAPGFAAPKLDGDGQLALEQYRGKIVYLDFWASWCGPCLKSIPAIEAMRKEFPASKVQILAVNLDQKSKKALRFLEKNPIGYPSVHNPAGDIPKSFGLETMPTSYLIDANGVVRYVHRGYQSGDIEEIRSQIRKLIGRK